MLHMLCCHLSGNVRHWLQQVYQLVVEQSIGSAILFQHLELLCPIERSGKAAEPWLIRIFGAMNGKMLCSLLQSCHFARADPDTYFEGTCHVAYNISSFCLASLELSLRVRGPLLGPTNRSGPRSLMSNRVDAIAANRIVAFGSRGAQTTVSSVCSTLKRCRGQAHFTPLHNEVGLLHAIVARCGAIQ